MEVRFDLSRRRLAAAAEKAGFDSLVLAGEPNLVYALGYGNPAGVLVLSGKCGSTLVVPLLDYERALRSVDPDVEVKAFYRGGESGIEPDIPKSDVISSENIAEAARRVLEGCSKPAVDFKWLRWETATALSQVLGSPGDASQLISQVRSVKEEWEISLIAEAARIAEAGLRRGLDALEEGVSEREVAGAVVDEIMRSGGWGPSFPVIVAFGANTALPHHHTGDTRLPHASPVLFDLGAIYKGYMSDMTRSLWRGPGGGEFRRLEEAVAEAQGEAIDSVAPGAEAWEVDKAARLRLSKEGYSKYFIHGTGHGVGVEIHEAPYLRPGSSEELKPGMVVTVEPGVYLPGMYGVRIEDMVLVTRRGRKVLTSFARIL
ncbi:aminopeptidase P family protein [Aeropyrum camini]|uniref:Xaa-Pro dipeptidase n=1 Tax=Aeropyrum camini SY1 = JCM 12091 TaxID=1198449 RepID=U3TCW1_9CREN|nr:aminopeptidase P family protein [Aeropyrum camini]BAN89875.1 Xaa-Pro dipeptidase [Aeropyrum camini SY1 = JCM 12091]